jgi:hypothetical protein
LDVQDRFPDEQDPEDVGYGDEWSLAKFYTTVINCYHLK